MRVRRSSERGAADHGWLKSMHSFSFADYYDPKHMGFRSLRVINEDRIAGGQGFGMHPHRDMEIISYVMRGSLCHEDSMGTKSEIKPGEVQRMSAGSGILHSEMNDSDQETHFLQIWIIPNRLGEAPGYGQKSFASELTNKRLVLVVSEGGRDGSIAIKQDADLYISRLPVGESLEFQLRPNRGAWVQVISGAVDLNGTILRSGDAAAIEKAGPLTFKAEEMSELLIFDLL